MLKKTKFIFLGAGFFLLLFLFYSFGVEETIKNIQKMGFSFGIIILIYLFNHIFLTFGWKILINSRIRPKNFIKLILARIAGDSTSSINALGAVAGEPLKAFYIKDIIPFKIGLASVILDRTVHTLANILVILTGILVSLFVLPIPKYITLLTLIFILFTLYLIISLLKKQQQGFFNYIISKIPVKITNRFRIITPERQKKIDELDEEIKYIFKNRSNLRKFNYSLLIHYFSIIISGTLEIFLIIKFSGSIANLKIVDSLFVYIFGFLLTSAMFFMPANLGTSEGSYILALKLLGYKNFAGLGLYIGVVRRLRTFVWALIGVIILLSARILKPSLSLEKINESVKENNNIT